MKIDMIQSYWVLELGVESGTDVLFYIVGLQQPAGR